jgi:hypothetical protein
VLTFAAKMYRKGQYALFIVLSIRVFEHKVCMYNEFSICRLDKNQSMLCVNYVVDN